MPSYPDGAIKKGESGLVVALVSVREDGVVLNVKILEAPSESIKASVLTALGAWRFNHGTINGKATGITGKISFYFVLKKGVGIVFNPDDAPYVGRWPPEMNSRN